MTQIVDLRGYREETLYTDACDAYGGKHASWLPRFQKIEEKRLFEGRQLLGLAQAGNLAAD